MPNSKRSASVAGYCESITMLLSIHRLPGFHEGQKADRIRRTLNWLIDHALCTLYIPSTGDVGCYRRFGTLYDIRSIRWGSGLLKEALSRILAWPRNPDGNDYINCI
jgi:hypothetical protein